MTASTVVFVISREAIFVGADSASIISSPFRDAASESGPRVLKTTVVQDRIVVAAVGTEGMNITDRKNRPVFSYDFTTWMMNIKKKSPVNVSVTSLAHLIEVESGVTFKDFSKCISSGWARNRKQTPDPYIDYIVIGYEAGVPTAIAVYFRINWENLRLEGPFIKPTHLGDKFRIDNNIFAAGQADILTDLNNGKREAYQQLAALIPKELPKLLALQPSPE